MFVVCGLLYSLVVQLIFIRKMVQTSWQSAFFLAFFQAFLKSGTLECQERTDNQQNPSSSRQKKYQNYFCHVQYFCQGYTVSVSDSLSQIQLSHVETYLYWLSTYSMYYSRYNFKTVPDAPQSQLRMQVTTRANNTTHNQSLCVNE